VNRFNPGVEKNYLPLDRPLSQQHGDLFPVIMLQVFVGVANVASIFLNSHLKLIAFVLAPPFTEKN
jgi:hypothetical protein